VLHGRSLAAVVLSATAALPAGANAASLTATPYATGATSNIISDGARFAAYQTSTTSIRIVDTHRRLAHTASMPGSCALVAVGGGHVLAYCADPPGSAPLVFSASDARPSTVAGWDAVQARSRQTGAQVSAQAIGSHWLKLLASTTTIPSTWYLNWHTGQLLDEPASPRLVANLNTLSLTQTLCSPLRRTKRDLQEQAGLFWPFQYQRPWSVATTNDGTFTQRCGQHQRRRLLCPAGCPSMQLGSSAVTWATPSAAVLRLLKRARTYTVRVPGGSVSTAAHTRCTVFASSVTNRAPAPPEVAIYRARVPACDP
jgi:hypothetical protein